METLIYTITYTPHTPGIKPKDTYSYPIIQEQVVEDIPDSFFLSNEELGHAAHKCKTRKEIERLYNENKNRIEASDSLMATFEDVLGTLPAATITRGEQEILDALAMAISNVEIRMLYQENKYRIEHSDILQQAFEGRVV
ncbi:MAG: hypothetical protein EOP51_25690 [Sphingobacteriales bacterium]|nr:MAG: hypothetical protein EOP51_25690 [Sphingobacteriales bacterium]